MINTLTFIKDAGKTKGGCSLGLYKCTCGKEKVILIYNVKRGNTKSCGCLHNESLVSRMTTHGKSNTPTYKSWAGIKDRTLNIRNRNYKDYGGRGINVCDRWLIFENFLSDMGERPSASYSIERINNDSGYCKENCKWATIGEQNNNKRNSIFVEFYGVKQTLSEWATTLEVSKSTVSNRYKKGWSVERMLTTPTKKCKYLDIKDMTNGLA